jgi:hypothetical protein
VSPNARLCVYGGNSASSDGLLTVGTLAPQKPMNDSGLSVKPYFVACLSNVAFNQGVEECDTKLQQECKITLNPTIPTHAKNNTAHNFPRQPISSHPNTRNVFATEGQNSESGKT